MNKPTLGKWEVKKHHKQKNTILTLSPNQVIAEVIESTSEDLPNANLIVTAVNACQSINPKLPQAVADQIEAMYKICDCLAKDGFNEYIKDSVRAVLNAIEKGE